MVSGVGSEVESHLDHERMLHGGQANAAAVTPSNHAISPEQQLDMHRILSCAAPTCFVELKTHTSEFQPTTNANANGTRPNHNTRLLMLRMPT